MKTSHSSMTDRPRLTCRVVQGWCSVAGDGSAPQAGAWGARHVAACGCCGEFFGRASVLEFSLRQGARALSAVAVPGLEQRINDAVARSARVAAPRAGGSFPALAMGSWAFVGAAASVAVAVLVSQQMKGPGAGPRAGAVDGDLVVDTTGEGLLDRLSPDATALLEGEPLQREVDAMYSDARSALGFLALNFLPKSPEEPGVGVMPAVPVRRVPGG